MAQLVLGLGSSHGPQVSMLPEYWTMRGENDKRNPQLVGTDGKVYGYDELLSRADPAIAKELTPENLQHRHEANQRGIAKVTEALYRANPDYLVIVGDDQLELLRFDNMPAISIFWGETARDRTRFQPTPATGNAPLFGYSYEERSFPVASDLGEHLIRYLIESEFDIGHSRFLEEGKVIGHAYGYVYNRIFTRGVIPTVPIMLNTYHPPNQPTPKRCYELGRALRNAIEAWPSKARVALMASGGLSHFVVDQELDQMVMGYLKHRDFVQLSRLPRERLESGNSEIRSWITVGGATEHLDLKWHDYVPCYRTPAGTGVGMCFAQWA